MQCISNMKKSIYVRKVEQKQKLMLDHKVNPDLSSFVANSNNTRKINDEDF